MLDSNISLAALCSQVQLSVLNAVQLLGPQPIYDGTTAVVPITLAKQARQAALILGLVEITQGRAECVMGGPIVDFKCPLGSHLLHPDLRTKDCDACPETALLCQCHPCSFDAPVQVSLCALTVSTSSSDCSLTG